MHVNREPMLRVGVQTCEVPFDGDRATQNRDVDGKK
jgi:hypothetical protein